MTKIQGSRTASVATNRQMVSCTFCNGPKCSKAFKTAGRSRQTCRRRWMGELLAEWQPSPAALRLSLQYLCNDHWEDDFFCSDVLTQFHHTLHQNPFQNRSAIVFDTTNELVCVFTVANPAQCLKKTSFRAFRALKKVEFRRRILADRRRLVLSFQLLEYSVIWRREAMLIVWVRGHLCIWLLWSSILLPRSSSWPGTQHMTARKSGLCRDISCLPSEMTRS